MDWKASEKPMALSVQSFFGFSDKPGDLGVELEVEGLGLPKQANGWSVHVEHSLRGQNGRLIVPDDDQPDTPREYVTNGPVSLSELADRTDYLYGLLTRKGTTAVMTSRASTHFHVNMIQRTFRDVVGFMMAYVAIEPVLLRLCGPERNGNLFCVPCYESWDIAEHVARWDTAFQRGPSYWPGGANGRGKYSSMNIDPLARQGSIEIRCFPNEIRSVNIVKWGSWLLNLRSFAEQYEVFDYLGFIDFMYNSPNSILNKVFGQESLWGVCHPYSPNQLVEFGVEQAYEIHKATSGLFSFQVKQQKKKQKFQAQAGDYVVIGGVPEPEYDELSEHA